MKLFKKRFHPCGGFFLEGALKWLIPVNVLMLFVGLAMLAYDVYSLWDKWMTERVENQTDFYVRLGLWCGYIFHEMIAMPMDVYLYRAYKSKDPPHLRIWVVQNFFNTIWAAFVYWFHTGYFGIHFPTLTPYNFYCGYRFYMCVVVYYYAREVEDELETLATSRALTSIELKEFEEGACFSNSVELDIECKSLMEKVQYQRYKRDEFEISMEKLKLDNENPLGKGAYGVVYRGTFIKEPGLEVVVAVKTFHSALLDASCFKALLTELKVMTYLGHHENVVNLIGAVTSEILNRQLYMIVEFCPFGSVLEHLRASRGLFQNFVVNAEIEMDREIYTSSEDSVTTLDLVKWSLDTAKGMSFLTEKRVVHGDLAARNLLLTQSKQIKIGDFGLARQLYQYSIYVKRQNTPLPWRWLAIESLTDMNFSSKSDVWSFGVVLYELFALGEVPYNIKQFTLEFIEELRNGIRLERPVFCPDLIYKTMLECWNSTPESRPSFDDIRLVLENLLHASGQETINH